MKKKDLGLYIHIPFCVRKCAYCDFVSFRASENVQNAYFRSLLQELGEYQSLGNTCLIRTIYFGGGTPSIADPIQLMRILLLIRDHFLVAEDAEITIEVNPGTITRENLKAWKQIGINRLSIGLQSDNDDLLQTLGRIHTYDDFLAGYRAARAAGFDNISVDLMYSLPGQTPEMWMNTIRNLSALGPDHISAYALSIEEGTPFAKKYGTPEGAALLPSEEDDRKMYHDACEYLKAAGYERYEISNFAKPDRYSRHNMIYWSMGDYLGLGLNASSYMNGRRFANPADLNEYIRAVPKLSARMRENEPQTKKEAMEEFMFLGLRRSRGVTAKEFKEAFREDLEAKYGKVIKRLVRQRMLTFEDGRLALTDAGIDVSNAVLAEFLL
ncbi:MAG: oxygen-independent coproporphyrinogen III oxidase [Lachnospiraceae bacterium]|nr:oxygen-independent coproporphyrinogen III oxidase [Lachnospiraceae bacterium]